jgi:hypothetical protein
MSSTAEYFPVLYPTNIVRCESNCSGASAPWGIQLTDAYEAQKLVSVRYNTEYYKAVGLA